jgi:hypothetical protein
MIWSESCVVDSNETIVMKGTRFEMMREVYHVHKQFAKKYGFLRRVNMHSIEKNV